jgi:hypothetical protein
MFDRHTLAQCQNAGHIHDHDRWPTHGYHVLAPEDVVALLHGHDSLELLLDLSKLLYN